MPKATAAYLFLPGFLAFWLLWPLAEVRAEEPAPVEADAPVPAEVQTTASAEAAAPAEPTIEDLMTKLSSRDEDELYQAIQDLGLRGPEAAPAVKDLLKIFTSEKTSPNVRYETALALGRIGSAAKDAVPALIEALRSEDATLRGYAAGALSGIGPDAAAATKALAVALRDPNPAVRRNSAKALGAIKTTSAEAKTALEQAMATDSEKGVNENCKAALRCMDDEAKRLQSGK